MVIRIGRYTIISALAAVVLTACGGREQQTDVPFVAHVLRVASPEEPDGLNPFLSSYVSTVDMSFLWGEFLLNCDGNNQLVPEAATQVPTRANGGISPDGMSITYHIRRGIKWQDGAPLTAKDVAFTWRAIMNPKNNIPGRLGYDRIQSISTPDDLTVVLHMRERFSPIVNFFLAPEGGGPILPDHILGRLADINHAAFNTKPVGAGPFILTEWVRGDHVTFDANPAYWRGKPRLSKVVMKWIPSSQTIATELQTGEVDVWMGASPTMYGQLSSLPYHQFKLTQSSGYGHLDFNMRDPILRDHDVREAISLAIDRRRIVHEATHDVFLATNSDQPSFSWAYDRRLPPIAYDPARAKTMLDAAGWRATPNGVREKDGQRLSFTLSYAAAAEPGQTITSIIQEELRNVGIDVVQKPAAPNVLYASSANGGVLASGKYQMAYYIWENGVDPDDSGVYASNQMPPAGNNTLFWSDPKVDAAEHLALTTYDILRRKAAYATIQEEVVREVPSINLFAERRFDVYSLHFENFVPCPSQSAYWNTYQWDTE